MRFTFLSRHPATLEEKGLLDGLSKLMLPPGDLTIRVSLTTSIVRIIS